MIDYELLLAFSETLSEEDQKKTVTELESLIEKAKGALKKTEKWGKRSLSFQIKNNTNGFFWLLTVSGESNLPKVINDALRINGEVLRFIIEKKVVSKKPKKATKKKVLVPEIMR